MSRRRYISTQISLDTQVNRLAMEHGDFAALLYTWMIPHAEDNCLITGDPEQLLMQVVPGRRDKTVRDVEAAIEGMVALGLLRRVVGPDGKAYLQFPPASFYRYQTYIPEHKRAAVLAGNGAEHGDQRKTAQNTEEYNSALDTPQNGASPSPSPSPSPAPSPTKVLGTIGGSVVGGGPGDQSQPILPDATPTELAILHELKCVANYPFDYQKDLEHIRNLMTDYPELDLLSEAKKWRTYKRDKPLKAKSNARLQFRNWCDIALQHLKRAKPRARDAPWNIDRSGEIEPPEDVQAEIDPTIPEHLLRRSADSA